MLNVEFESYDENILGQESGVDRTPKSAHKNDGLRNTTKITANIRSLQKKEKKNTGNNLKKKNKNLTINHNIFLF